MNREVWLDEFATLARALLSVPTENAINVGEMDRRDISVHTPEINRQTQRLEGALHQVVGGNNIWGSLTKRYTTSNRRERNPFVHFFYRSGYRLIEVWWICETQQTNNKT